MGTGTVCAVFSGGTAAYTSEDSVMYRRTRTVTPGYVLRSLFHHVQRFVYNSLVQCCAGAIFFKKSARRLPSQGPRHLRQPRFWQRVLRTRDTG